MLRTNDLIQHRQATGEGQEYSMTEQTNGYSRDEQRFRPFNPNEHVIEIKTKNGLADYLPVQWRCLE